MNKLQKIILFLAVFFLGVFAGQNSEFRKPLPLIGGEKGTSEKTDLSLFWRVWDTLEEKYLDKNKLNRDKMVNGAIGGLVSSLGDPYTVYLSPEANKSFKDNLSGKYSGVGIQLGYRSGKMVVIAPLDETPASREGVEPNDQILKIDDKDTQDLTLPQAVSLIRGEKGTKIKLTLLHEGQEKPYEVNLTREEITIKSVILKSLGGVAYLKLTQFGDNTKEEWDKNVGEVLNKNYQRIILDLRNNPGGRFDKAISIASEFLEKGIAARQEWYNGRKQEYPLLGSGKLTKIPLVVLVNRGSASASEILAGALQDHKRAKLVGEKTFGKGTVQEVEEFDNGGGLHISSSKWLTPGGIWVDESKGLKPDREVKTDSEEHKDSPQVLEKDPFIKAALESF